MGTTIIYVISPYTFLMGVLWFNVFALLGLLVRKLKHPLKFSVMPLAVLLILSLFRMFLIVEFPITRYIKSEIIFPAVISALRFELFGTISVLSVLLFVWGTVSLVLLIRYVYRFCRLYRKLILLAQFRDHESEEILSEMIGSNHVRVFRANVKVPCTLGIKPYIFIPENVDLTRNELRTILRHEWKHIESKDQYVNFFMNFLDIIFWWNPLVYILKRNVKFAQELRCDYYAVAMSDDDPQHYVNAIFHLGGVYETSPVVGQALVSGGDEVSDRFGILKMRVDDKTRQKQTLATVCFYVFAIALFVFSYTFMVIPAHWESPDVVRIGSIEYDLGCYYREEAYKAGENYIVDNGDGTFSLYIDGQYVLTKDNTDSGIFDFLPIIEREG